MEKVKIINAKKIDNTLHFKCIIVGSENWSNGIYWGNAEIENGEVTGDYYLRAKLKDEDGFSLYTLGWYRFIPGDYEASCSACFDSMTEGWSDDDKARFAESLRHNSQYPCGRGHYFGDCSEPETDQAGIDYHEMEDLLKTAGLL